MCWTDYAVNEMGSDPHALAAAESVDLILRCAGEDEAGLRKAYRRIRIAISRDHRGPGRTLMVQAARDLCATLRITHAPPEGRKHADDDPYWMGEEGIPGA